jgi:PKD repeat protein
LGNPTTWAWEFDGDGFTDSILQNPSFTYQTAGTYTVKLIVSRAGQSDEEIKTDLITVQPLANFTATPTSGPATLAVTFTDTSSGNPTSWAWDFDNDGVTDSTAQDPSFAYTMAGTYTVKLTVSRDDLSDEEIKTDLITVQPLANFTATPTSGPAPLAVTFTDTSLGSPTGWAWDFENDGVTDSTVQNPSFTYTAGESYTVKLAVSRGGQSDEEIKTGLITVQPVANFTATSTTGVAPLTATFTDTSVGNPTSWAWDFDNDGAIDSILQRP